MQREDVTEKIGRKIVEDKNMWRDDRKDNHVEVPLLLLATYLLIIKPAATCSHT